MTNSNLCINEVFNQVMKARTRIYQLAPATALEVHSMPGGWRMLLKREDLSPVHSYKWRGAFNFLKSNEKLAKNLGLVAASAGNHAQGVALAASKLGLSAHLFMPKSAPRLKVESVAGFGGSWVEIHQIGDNFDEAALAAHEYCRENGCLYVPPYDDVLVMAGQGVVGDEIMTSAYKPDIVFVQIGGGGLAAGVASVIKTYSPQTKVIGVEESGQASMKAAFEAGKPVNLDHVDVFCDGTAVKKAGEHTFAVLKDLLDDLVVVNDSDVSSAIQELWRVARVVPEPSGALGFAAALKMSDQLADKNVGVILTGANLDFRQLGVIARKAGAALEKKAYYQIKLNEQPGAMLNLLKVISSLGINISHLMYGQNDLKVAFPVLGFDGDSKKFESLEVLLKRHNYEYQDVSSRVDIPFRVAPFQPHLFKLPFAAILNFPERAGALTEFMDRVANFASISYFNYMHSGEQIGRALVVLSFNKEDDRKLFLLELEKKGPHYTELAQDTFMGLGLHSHN